MPRERVELVRGGAAPALRGHPFAGVTSNLLA